MNPTAEYVRECLEYDPETGVFLWKERPREHFKREWGWNVHKGCTSGKVAGAFNNQGYSNIQLDGKKYKAHRLAWLMTYGEWPSKLLDHINGDRGDNRLSNLREATNTENCLNAKLSMANKSGTRGVYWHKLVGKWRARISIGGVTTHLGFYENRDEASEAVRKARIKHHGEFANHVDRTLPEFV